MAGVTSVDASGVRALQRFAAAAAQLHATVVVFDPPTGTVNALQTTGLLEVFRSPTDRGGGVGNRTNGGDQLVDRRHDSRIRARIAYRTDGSLPVVANASARSPV